MILVAVSVLAAALPMQSFDAASVKMNQSALQPQRSLEEGPPPPPQPPIIKASPGRLTMSNITLHSCILWAWNLPDFQVSSSTRTEQTTYEITAVAAEKAPEPQLRLMLRTLLAERFRLKVHFEQQEHQITQLLLARGGPKFGESSATEFEYKRTPERMVWRDATMQSVASALFFPESGMIVDATGLRGHYDITLVRPAMRSGSAGDFYLAWRDALEKQLGLTMKLGKGKIDVLVVDHAEERPSPN